MNGFPKKLYQQVYNSSFGLSCWKKERKEGGEEGQREGRKELVYISEGSFGFIAGLLAI